VKEEFYAEYFRIEDRHWWFIGRRRIFLTMLDRHLERAASETREILDLGCGTGTMLGYLEQYGKVTGLDADEQAIRFCRQRGVENVRLLESERLPFPDQSFDLVTAFDVLEHIRDDRRTLDEIRRVLRPDGTILAAVPAHPWLWGAQDEISHHERRYTKSELKNRIGAAGLDLRRLSYFNTILSAPIAAIRLARRFRRPHGELRSDFEMSKEEGPLNDLLARLFGSEARWVSSTGLPFGISLLALARRTDR
jgi:SAM-dependent methyltransferase